MIEIRNHKMIPAGVLADHGELQCIFCGATNLTTMGHPKDFDCPKNPDTDPDYLTISMIKKAYLRNIKPSVDGGCSPCCACCQIVYMLGKELGIDEKDPVIILEITETVTVQARCNKCKSSDIAIIIKRTPIAPDGPEDSVIPGLLYF